jgi:hypothetical protein
LKLREKSELECEAARERDLGERGRSMRHHLDRALQPHALDERGERLADQRLEHAVKMERREVRDAGDLLEVERLGQVLRDVVDRSVDARDVVHFRKIWQVVHPGRGYCRANQKEINP